MAERIYRACTFARRYIDDLEAINNPYLRHLLYDDIIFFGQIHGIYPKSLKLIMVQEGTSAIYIDITIYPARKSTRLTTILYDKREHPPLCPLFVVICPHASLQISSMAKYGVITGQLHRFWRNICYTLTLFSGLQH